MAIRFVHTNLIARDWKCLADFYAAVFGCEPAGPGRDLHGAWLDDATGIPNARIRGRHMRLPGYGSDGPTLEIFEYEPAGDRPEHAPSTPGFGHIAFAVDDIPTMADAIVHAGGRAVGDAVRVEIAGAGWIEFQYLADPEGNIIEIQRWD